MNSHPRFPGRPAAFTLVELLTVIAIIAILAALLLPVISIATTKAKVARAKTEEADLVNAIEAYDSAYGRLPVSQTAQQQANANAQANGNPDFTYGGTFVSQGQTTTIGTTGQIMGSTPYVNSEVIAILMDMTAYPNGATNVNTGHVKNPKQTQFLNAKLSSYNGTGSPVGGVDTGGTYRDPWGNPYIITMDLNYDGECQDVIYCSNSISGNPQGSATGFNGLFNPTIGTANPNPDEYLYRGKVMVWSLGPDLKFSTGQNANSGFNQDNVLSWK